MQAAVFGYKVSQEGDCHVVKRADFDILGLQSDLQCEFLWIRITLVLRAPISLGTL